MKIKHTYQITTVLFGLTLSCLIADLAWTVLHPRPTRFFYFVVLLYFAVKLFRERDSKKCIWRQEYQKQKEQAEEKGIPYIENRRVVRNPKIYLMEIPLILVIISGILYLPNATWPYRANWEYQEEIAWYKNKAKHIEQEFGEDYGKKYEIFPDAIPKEAKCVKWYSFPGFWQSWSCIYLSMKMPMESIQDTIRCYASKAEILYYTEDEDGDPQGWWNGEILSYADEDGNTEIEDEEAENENEETGDADREDGDTEEEDIIGFDSFPGIDCEDKQAENVVIYLLSEDCGPETGYGFWVNEKESLICFFARGRS